MIIRIKNMRLRGIVGINPPERTDKQAINVSAEIEFDGTRASETDQIEHTIDYRDISKQIATLVETSEFFLVETLASRILDLILQNPLVERAQVEVDKPFAIKFADSTSITVAGTRVKAQIQ